MNKITGKSSKCWKLIYAWRSPENKLIASKHEDSKVNRNQKESGIGSILAIYQHKIQMMDLAIKPIVRI